jgi:hypothetical protein
VSHATPVIYDVHEDFHDHPWPFVEAYCEWLQTHGVDHKATYRTEHHLIDAPLVRVFQYDEDEQGCRYVDEATGDAAVRRPFDVLEKTPPPSPEDYA